MYKQNLFSHRKANLFALYSETCLKQPSKIDKTKILKPCGSLMQVKSIAERSP